MDDLRFYKNCVHFLAYMDNYVHNAMIVMTEQM
jgi:hypothetical protein